MAHNQTTERNLRVAVVGEFVNFQLCFHNSKVTSEPNPKDAILGYGFGSLSKGMRSRESIVKLQPSMAR